MIKKHVVKRESRNYYIKRDYSFIFGEFGYCDCSASGDIIDISWMYDSPSTSQRKAELKIRDAANKLRIGESVIVYTVEYSYPCPRLAGKFYDYSTASGWE